MAASALYKNNRVAYSNGLLNPDISIEVEQIELGRCYHFYDCVVVIGEARVPVLLTISGVCVCMCVCVYVCVCVCTCR